MSENIKSLDDLTLAALGNLGKLFSVDSLQAIQSAGGSLLSAVSAGSNFAMNVAQSASDVLSGFNDPSNAPSVSQAEVSPPTVAVVATTGVELTGTLPSPVTGSAVPARGQDGPQR